MEIPHEPNALTYSFRDNVTQGKMRQPGSIWILLMALFCASGSAKIPNTLEPLPANKARRAPAWSRVSFARLISGSISKITDSKSFCKSLYDGHGTKLPEIASSHELERIGSLIIVVKALEFTAAYASAVETVAFGVMTIKCVVSLSSLSGKQDT